MNYKYYSALLPNGNIKQGINRISFDENDIEITREYFTIDPRIASGDSIDNLTEDELIIINEKLK